MVSGGGDVPRSEGKLTAGGFVDCVVDGGMMCRRCGGRPRPNGGIGVGVGTLSGAAGFFFGSDGGE